LVLLWFEQAINRRSFVRATWSGAAFAMIVLGTHPQMTLYAGLFVALWSFGGQIRNPQSAICNPVADCRLRIADCGFQWVWWLGRVRFQAGVCLALLFFSLGGAVLVQWLPGFRLFQIPARMLILLALPIALLAGKTTQALMEHQWAPALRQQCRRMLSRVIFV